MKLKINKKITIGLFLLFILPSTAMLIPRVTSVLNASKVPIGYHFVYPTYFALFIGLEKLIDITPVIPNSVTEIKNIEYKNKDGNPLYLSVYIPKNIEKPVPLLLFVHGGGWSGGKKEDYLTYLLSFAEKGYVTATVSYRLSGTATYPAARDDVRDAVNWLYTHSNDYGYDKNKIAIIGGSAGAHLALLAAYSEQESNHKIKAVVDLYGPVDLTTEYARTQPDVTSFIGKSYESAPLIYKEASPLFYITKNSPPTLIFHGTSDTLVPISQSDDLHTKLDSLHVPNTYYRLPLWPHTMDIVLRVNDFTQEKMEDFFRKYLK